MKIGFIGVGNMGGAILKGLVSAGESQNTYNISGRDFDKAKKMAADLGVDAFDGAEKLVEASDMFFVGVKPNMFDQVLPEVAKGYDKEKICVSMAAGITMDFIEKYLGRDAKVIRIMPNTPALVGEGMISVSRNTNVSDEEVKFVLELLGKLGKAEEVPEEMIHGVIGVSGSSPAYTYMYINALAKNAEANGIKPEAARVFAAQAVLGAAKMVLETDTDLDQLVTNVCSPGGTTIEAVEFLKKAKFEKTVQDAAQAAVDKSIKMNS